MIFWIAAAALAWTPPKDLAAAKKKLSAEAREITQREGTEPPFRNAYHDNHREGLYVDVVSGEPLFLSIDKYDSGTGWPSFTKPIAPLEERRDADGQRTEVRSKLANSHLGHVFDDGPPPTHKRYCMNSAAMRFIPREKLAAEGYGEFVGRFKK